MIITRFPDAATIRRWYEAPPYQALIPLRDQAVKMGPDRLRTVRLISCPTITCRKARPRQSALPGDRRILRRLIDEDEGRICRTSKSPTHRIYRGSGFNPYGHR